MPARSVCLVTLSLFEAGPGRFGRQVSVTDIYHTIPYHPRGEPSKLFRWCLPNTRHAHVAAVTIMQQVGTLRDTWCNSNEYSYLERRIFNGKKNTHQITQPAN